MKLPLLLDSKVEVNKRGPEVLLGKGTWRLESNTNLFVVRLKGHSSDSEGLLVGSPVLLLDEITIVQIELTGKDVNRATIFAVKQPNGTDPSKHSS